MSGPWGQGKGKSRGPEVGAEPVCARKGRRPVSLEGSNGKKAGRRSAGRPGGLDHVGPHRPCQDLADFTMKETRRY